MVDEVGLDQLSLTALAQRLGVRQPSLYKHIDSMAGLRRSIAIQAKVQLGEVLARAAVGRSGADAIIAMSAVYRDWALKYPARYQASMIMPGPEDEEQNAVALAAVSVIADVLTAYELEGDDAIDAIRAFRSTLHGFITLESQGAFALAADTQRSFDRMVRGFVVALTHWTQTTTPDSGVVPTR